MSGGDVNEAAAATVQPLMVEMKTEQGAPTIIQMLTPHGVMQMQALPQVPSSAGTIALSASSATSQPGIANPPTINSAQLEVIQRALLQQVLQPISQPQQQQPQQQQQQQQQHTLALSSTQDAVQAPFVQIQLMKEQIEQHAQQFQAEQVKVQSKQQLQKQQEQQQLQQQKQQLLQQQQQQKQQRKQQQKKSQKLAQKQQLQMQLQQEQSKNEGFPSLVSQLQSGTAQVTQAQIQQIQQLQQLQASYQLQTSAPSPSNQFQVQMNTDLGSVVKLATQDVDISREKLGPEYQAASSTTLAPAPVSAVPELSQAVVSSASSSSIEQSTLMIHHPDLHQAQLQADQMFSSTSQTQVPQFRIQLAGPLTTQASQVSSNLIPIAIRRIDRTTNADTTASSLPMAAPTSVVLQPGASSLSAVSTTQPLAAPLAKVSVQPTSASSGFFPIQTFSPLGSSPLSSAGVTSNTFSSHMSSSQTPTTTPMASIALQGLSLSNAQSPLYTAQTSTPIPPLDRPISQPVLQPGKMMFDEEEDRMTAASLLLNNLAQGGGTDDSTKTEADDTETVLDVSSMHTEHLSPVTLVQDLPEKPLEPAVLPEEEAAFSDSLLWCYDCGALVRVYCRQHGSLSRIRDRVIPPRAKLTAPHHVSVKILELRAGGNHVFGVFAKKVIQKRSQFGHSKMINKDGTSEFYDNTNQKLCNWLMYIRPANNLEEQNLIAYQFRGKLYFTSIKTIAPNDELKVWYAENYRQALNAEKLKGSTTDNYTELVPIQSDAHEGENKDFDDIIADNEEYRQQMGMDQSVSLDVSVNFLTRPFELPPIDPPSPAPPQAPSTPPPTAPAVQTVTGGEQEPSAPEEVDDVEDEDNDRWTCSACSAQFDSLTLFDAHDCETKVDTGRRTRSKRKGHPVKRDLELTETKQPQKRSRGRSRRSNVTKNIPIAPKLPAIPPDESACHPSSPGSLPQTAALQDTPLAPDRSIKVQPGVGLMKRKPPNDVGQQDSGALEHKAKRKVSKPSAPLFRCNHCTMAFSTMGKLKMHSYTHTGERPFRCSFPECDKAFTSKFKQIRHELIHTGTKQHLCPYCQKNFSRKDHLKNHLRVHDPHKQFHKCQTCGKEYASPFAFKTHLAFHAAEEGELTCLVCKEEFSEKLPLIVHLKIHAGARSVKDASEKNQKCPLCNKCFFTRKDVKRHLVVHTKDRDFLCQFCPQRFGRRDHLVRHLKKAHTNESSGMALDLSDDFMEPLPTTQVSALPDSPSDGDGQSQMVTELIQTVARSILDSPAALSQSSPQQGQQQANTNLLGLIKMKTEDANPTDPSTLNVAIPVPSLPLSIANLPSTSISIPTTVPSAAPQTAFLNYGITAQQMPSGVRTFTLPAGFTALRPQTVSAVDGSPSLSEQINARQTVPAAQSPAPTVPLPTPATVGSSMSKLDPPLSVQMAGSSPALVQGITLPAGHELIQTPQGHVIINYTLKTVLDQYTTTSAATATTTS